MRIKVITKDHGEFISDELSIECEELGALVDTTSKGGHSNLKFNYNGGKIFFTEEVLKTSVFIVTKD
jgi:hypothetical protein